MLSHSRSYLAELSRLVAMRSQVPHKPGLGSAGDTSHIFAVPKDDQSCFNIFISVPSCRRHLALTRGHRQLQTLQNLPSCFFCVLQAFGTCTSTVCSVLWPAEFDIGAKAGTIFSGLIRQSHWRAFVPDSIHSREARCPGPGRAVNSGRGSASQACAVDWLGLHTCLSLGRLNDLLLPGALPLQSHELKRLHCLVLAAALTFAHAL